MIWEQVWHLRTLARSIENAAHGPHYALVKVRGKQFKSGLKTDNLTSSSASLSALVYRGDVNHQAASGPAPLRKIAVSLLKLYVLNAQCAKGPKAKNL